MMSHFFSQCGFTVLQILGYRLEIIDRKRNPILSQTIFPVYAKKEFKIGKYAIKFNKV